MLWISMFSLPWRKFTIEISRNIFSTKASEEEFSLEINEEFREEKIPTN
jgi:hypothetical protein